MKKIIHLVPYDGTGGVEVAARSMANVSDPDFDFSIKYIYPPVPQYAKRSVTFLPFPILRAWWQLYVAKPDVLVLSLWRSCIVGLLLKLSYRRVRLVLFLHSTQDIHQLDKWFTRLGAVFADEWWGDSKATLDQRINGFSIKPSRVISFVTWRLNPSVSKALTPTFIFWGRITEAKALERAVSIFAAVRKAVPDARYIIIGPDGGQLQQIKAEVAKLGLEDSVTFCGEMRIDQIECEAEKASFYLQTSLREGMAMSVVEGMQMGLVPVVTPVGEIAHYARHGENAVVVTDDASAVADVDGLLNEQQVADWLRGLDVYVHATDGETLSTSLLQAMATGLPIVASAIDGVTNLLGSAGEYGVCATNDADEFTHAILRVADSHELLNALGSRARDRILNRYSNQVMLESYLDVIAECR